ncbi:transglutaminase domain-containing protein [Candidatus Roizmanbacteria bacterium]|nr:transglutaminase domain-containing protein [Candidatus Roizmanbacteria bacterium]
MRSRILLFLFISLFLFVRPVSASEIKSDYVVEYFLSDSGVALSAHVKFSVTITNLTNTSYIKKLSLSFPKSYSITNLKTTDDKGQAVSEIQYEENKINILLEFTDPTIGKDKQNTFYVEFDQGNLFRQNGAVWEVMLPTLQDASRASYQVKVHLPENTTRKIAISKPNPTSIHGTEIYWDNPKTKTIYAIFGDKQFYETQLQYHLENPKASPVYMELALPPDTLYQRIYLESISPQPVSVYSDEDGNFIARYNLKAKERVDVTAKAVLEVVTKPRSDIEQLTASQVEGQASYLLSPSKYWDLSSTNSFPNLSKPQDIYSYLVSHFSYDYSRLGKNLKRMGAEQAVLHPEQAVCVEFTDAFVAISREKGILSREMEGYGYSQDPELRPLSADADVLHAWPEYYHPQKKIWIPIDPTWENTSGLDYFSSFDVSHLVFVIHGKSSEFPYPAGSYKTGQSKDVFVQPVALAPEAQVQISVDAISIPSQIIDRSTYKTKITIVNQSNVYVYNVPLEIKSDYLFVSPDTMNIPLMVPGERKEIVLEYGAREKGVRRVSRIDVQVMNKNVYSAKVIIAPFTYSIALKLALAVGAIAIIWLFFFVLKRKKV